MLKTTRSPARKLADGKRVLMSSGAFQLASSTSANQAKRGWRASACASANARTVERLKTRTCHRIARSQNGNKRGYSWAKGAAWIAAYFRSTPLNGSAAPQISAQALVDEVRVALTATGALDRVTGALDRVTGALDRVTGARDRADRARLHANRARVRTPKAHWHMTKRARHHTSDD